MKTDKEFLNTLEDNIRIRGAMTKLISDRAKIKDILRAYKIDDWESEPHHQHQNYAERHYATMKSRVNVIMNRTGAPGYTWLLCLQYVAYLYNHISVHSLEWRTPLQLLTGETTDISIMLHFTFWEEVYYSKYNSNFPSDTTEEAGYFVGFAVNVGDCITIQNYKTHHVSF
jgi:hypothetical protein